MKNLTEMYDIYVLEKVFPRSVRIDNKLTGETNATNMPSVSTNDKVVLGEIFDGSVQELLLTVGYTQTDIERFLQEDATFMSDLDERHNLKTIERKQIELTDEHNEAFNEWQENMGQELLNLTRKNK